MLVAMLPPSGRGVTVSLELDHAPRTRITPGGTFCISELFVCGGVAACPGAGVCPKSGVEMAKSKRTPKNLDPKRHLPGGTQRHSTSAPIGEANIARSEAATASLDSAAICASRSE